MNTSHERDRPPRRKLLSSFDGRLAIKTKLPAATRIAKNGKGSEKMGGRNVANRDMKNEYWEGTHTISSASGR